MTASAPLRLAYWLEPGQLMAGAYPGHPDPAVARRQLGALLDCGVRSFASLMEEGPRGAPPYAPLLGELARERHIRIETARFPVEDHDVPDTATLAALMAWLERAQPAVYVHCWGGRGRTGVVAGVHLIRRGRATPGDFVEVLAALRAGAPGGSPETPEQIAYVRRVGPA